MAKQHYIPLALFGDTTDLDEDRLLTTLPPHFSDDFKQACQYLLSYQHKETTFRVYRRELERLCQWLWFISNLQLVDVQAPDLEKYLTFCACPPKTWIANANVKRFITLQGTRVQNPRWRPFVCRKSDGKIRSGDYRPAEKSLRDMLGFLTGFFKLLFANRLSSEKSG